MVLIRSGLLGRAIPPLDGRSIVSSSILFLTALGVLCRSRDLVSPSLLIVGSSLRDGLGTDSSNLSLYSFFNYDVIDSEQKL